MRPALIRMPGTEISAADVRVDLGDTVVRPWRGDDADSLVRAVTVSIDELARWLPWAKRDYCAADAREWIAFCERSWHERSAFPFGVFASDGAAIGGVGINRIDAQNRCGSLGYWVATTHTRRGHARRAARAAAEFGFRELGLCRVEILILPDNRASRRVAEAIGAQWECDARARIQHAGLPATAAVYALLPDELRA